MDGRLARAALVTLLGLAVLSPVEGAAATREPTTPTFSEPYLAHGATRLVDVVCPGPQRCLAIGDDVDGTAPYGPDSVAYRSTDGGTSWAPSSEPGSGPSLALSCGSPAFCIEESLDYFNEPTFDVTRDGGLTWLPTGGPDTEAQLSDLSCAGTGTCLAIEASRVLSTTDGGLHWALHARVPGLVGVGCRSSRLCYVLVTSTEHGRRTLRVSSTANRGGSLTTVATLPGPSAGTGPASLECTAAGCDVVTSGDGASLYASSDGGHRWSSHELPVSHWQHVWSLSCVDEDSCTVLASESFQPRTVWALSTTDRGATWSTAQVVVAPPVTPAVACATPSTCYATTGVESIYASGAPTDQWTTAAIAAATPLLQAVACTPTDTCLAVGDGTEAVSTDDGHSWTVQADPALAGDEFEALTCPFASTCLASGHTTGSEQTALVLVSADAGAHWSAGSLPWEVTSVGSISCATSSTCVAVPGVPGDYGPIPTLLLRSTDGGMDWALLTLAPTSSYESLTSVACTTSTHCVAVGYGYASAPGPALPPTALAATSDDAGATWTLLPSVDAGEASFFGLACGTSTQCLTNGDGSYAYGTSDGGTDWTKLGSPGTLGDFESLDVVACSAQTCWGIEAISVASPVFYELIVSTDGGATWTLDPRSAAAIPTTLTISSDGAVIALGIEPSGGPVILAST